MAAILTRIKREDIKAYVEDAKAKKKNKADHVRAKIGADFPELIGMKVVRNGKSYDALEYLIGDLESYG